MVYRVIAPHHFYTMFYVYVLRSLRDGGYYIGFTQDLRRRFKEHSAGESFSTKRRAPFELLYYEAYKSEKDARIRESRLKRFKNGYKELLKRMPNSIV